MNYRPNNSRLFHGDNKHKVVLWDQHVNDNIPQAKVEIFDNEFNYSLRVAEEKTFGIKYSFVSDDISNGRDSKALLENPNFKNECYTTNELFEWLIYIKKKPLSNKIYFTKNDKGVIWEPQKPLTSDEIKRGINRPDDIQGSFALYCPKQNHIIGSTNYMSGKVGHVPAPYIVLLDGTKIKCKMTIEDIYLVIEIPLDIYLSWNWDIALPLDPTFGYSTAGASNYGGFGHYYVGNPYTPASAGTMSSISIYSSHTSNGKIVLGLYENATLRDYTTMLSGALSAGWHSIDTVVDYAITAIEYKLVYNYNDGSGYNTVYYDSATYTYNYDSYYGFSGVLYGGDNINWSNGSNMKWSIYGTFAESGGSAQLSAVNGITLANFTHKNSLTKAQIGKIKGLTIA